MHINNTPIIHEETISPPSTFQGSPLLGCCLGPVLPSAQPCPAEPLTSALCWYLLNQQLSWHWQTRHSTSTLSLAAAPPICSLSCCQNPPAGPGNGLPSKPQPGASSSSALTPWSDGGLWRRAPALHTWTVQSPARGSFADAFTAKCPALVGALAGGEDTQRYRYARDDPSCSLQNTIQGNRRLSHSEGHQPRD